MIHFKKFITPACWLICLLAQIQLYAQSELIKNLKTGKDQVLVVYGTSLSSAPGGIAWVDSVKNALNKKYGNHLKLYNSGKSAMWSTWAVKNLEDSIISKKPDAVLIEFGINDAFKTYNTSVELAQLNLEYLINRIKLYNPKCEVILQVMNMPVDKAAESRPELQNYYNMYRKVASKRKLLLIDHYPNWEKILRQGKEHFLKYVPDGIHPSVSSARSIIAPYVLKRLEEGR